MDEDPLEPRARLVQLIAGLVARGYEGAGKTGVTEPGVAARTMAENIVAALRQTADEADAQRSASIWIISPGAGGVASLKLNSPRGAQIIELLRFVP